MVARKTFGRMGKRTLPFIGAIVLAACGTLDPKQPGPSERVATGRDLRAAVHTFVPEGEFNPTSYIALSGTRTPDGNVNWSPFIATWQATQNGKYAWHLGGIGNVDNPEYNALIAGVRTSLAGGKVVVGAGTTRVNGDLSKELAAKFKLPADIEMTFSADARDFGRTSVANAKIPLGTVMGTAVTLFAERNRNGQDHWRIGPTFERGRWAFDHAYDNYYKTHTGQLSYSFGEGGRHFLALTPVYDQTTGKLSTTFTINWSFYGGRKSSPRRRIPVRRPFPSSSLAKNGLGRKDPRRKGYSRLPTRRR